MRCARCDSDNPTDTKFCIQCGVPLKYQCPYCGAADLPQAKFCGTCGMALTNQPPDAVLLGYIPRYLAKEIPPKRTARATHFRLGIVKIISTLELIAKALLLLSGIAILTFVGVWIYGLDSLTTYWLLDTLPVIIAQLGKALLLVFLIMLTIAFIRVIWAWMFEADSITVASFADASFTTTGVDSNRNKGGGLGNAISESLAAEIYHINQTYALQTPWGSEEEGTLVLAMPNLQAYERLGMISFAGIQLPVGEAALALKALLPSRYIRYVITGSVQMSLSGESAIVMTRLEENGQARKYWSREVPLTDDAEMRAHIRELAYQIMSRVLGESIGEKTLKDLIEGVALFRQYKDTDQPEAFDKAERYLVKVTKDDKKYTRAHFYLGNLYNWRAYFAPLESEDEQHYREKAMRHYEEAGYGYAVNPYEAESFMNFGMGLVYHRAYYKIRNRYQERFMEKLPELHTLLIKAHNYYTRVANQDEDFYFARTGRALIYIEKEHLSPHGLDGRDKPELFIHCAIKELRHAQYIASYRNDDVSSRSIERMISDLKRVERKEMGIRNVLSKWLQSSC
jgi:hypothetical protein